MLGRTLLWLLPLAFGACASPDSVSQAELQTMLPFIRNGETTRAELSRRLGAPDWTEMRQQAHGYSMSRISGRAIERGTAYLDAEAYDLVVIFGSDDRVKAHALLVVAGPSGDTVVRRKDLDALPASLSLGDLLLRLGRPHELSQTSPPRFGYSAEELAVSRVEGGFAVWGWGNTGPHEYEYGGNQPGGFLVVQLGPEFEVRRHYIVDRKRWEDNITEGVEQTKKYWRFLDAQHEQ